MLQNMMGPLVTNDKGHLIGIIHVFQKRQGKCQDGLSLAIHRLKRIRRAVWIWINGDQKIAIQIRAGGLAGLTQDRPHPAHSDGKTLGHIFGLQDPRLIRRHHRSARIWLESASGQSQHHYHGDEPHSALLKPLLQSTHKTAANQPFDPTTPARNCPVRLSLAP